MRPGRSRRPERQVGRARTVRACPKTAPGHPPVTWNGLRRRPFCWPTGQPSPRRLARGDTGRMGGDRADFFVSHAGADRAWAEWAAWQLKQAGYAVELDVWDWAAGQNFIAAISDALDRCDRVV